jgi:DivIVA domain-containing protein
MNPGHLARLTPDTVQSVTFRAARRGRRGLDHDHVREFCQQVEAELAQLAAERAALQDEVRRLRQRVLSGGDLARAPRHEAHVHAASILSQAQKTADRYIAEAQDYSRHLAEHARRRRDEILAQTQSEVIGFLALSGQEAQPGGVMPPGRPMPDDARRESPALRGPGPGGPRPASPAAYRGSRWPAASRADLTLMAAPVDQAAPGQAGWAAGRSEL